MGYRHTNNLYKDQRILLFKECYATEKIHGTSAHLKWSEGKLTYFSGGEKYPNFVALFDEAALMSAYTEHYGTANIVVYGEAYGGRCQGMSKTYGKNLKFIGFEVCFEGSWLDVPNAADICAKLNIDFVDYVRISTDLEVIDHERDRDSVQSIRNGMGEGHMREGVVLRPLVEVTTNNGDRIMAKHKRPEFSETKTPREVSPDGLVIMLEASGIADEWVTEMRLQHVMDAIQAESGMTEPFDMKHTGKVIMAMQADIYREAKDEIVESKAVSNAIAKKTAGFFKKFVQTIPDGATGSTSPFEGEDTSSNLVLEATL